MLVCTSRISHGSSGLDKEIFEMKAHVIGSVQGIGFRAQTKFLAMRLKLNGYVRNCADGSVEIVAQGFKEQLETLLVELKKTFKSRYIEEIKVEFYNPKNLFENFIIQI